MTVKHSDPVLDRSIGATASHQDPPIVLDAREVSQWFGDAQVLRDVSLSVRAGEIHALLGPNGAGKTTLVRILAGLLQPSSGSVAVAGYDPSGNARGFRRQIGFVASGDRTFYMRISGLENLVFFGRLHGMRRREAARRGREVLADVGLEEAANRPVGQYSHGMQKRLSVARAFLATPPVFLIDEATHDLDPEAARRVRSLVAQSAHEGAAVVWVTQRLEEIRGFTDAVTVLSGGSVRFEGTVPELMARAAPRRFVLHLGYDGAPPSDDALSAAIGAGCVVKRLRDPDARHYVLALSEDVVLGDALAAFGKAEVSVLSCHEERSEIEEAFLLLVEDGQA